MDSPAEHNPKIRLKKWCAGPNMMPGNNPNNAVLGPLPLQRDGHHGVFLHGKYRS